MSILWKINQAAIANSQSYKSYRTNDKFLKTQNMHTVLLVLKQMMSYCYKIIPQNTNGTSKSRQKSPLTKTQNVIYLMHFIHSFLSVSSDADIR